MLKLFTEHPASSGRTYLEHAYFAAKISVRLAKCSAFFMLHALLPFIDIPYNLNLESTALYLFERNNELED